MTYNLHFFFQMTTENINKNPWHIQSIYDFQYFNCPSCIFKNHSKQEFINHAYESHPESIDPLLKVKDNSLYDIVFPKNIKLEPIDENDDDLNAKSIEPTTNIKSEVFNIEEGSYENQINIEVFEEQSDDLNTKSIESEYLKDPKCLELNKVMKQHKCEKCGKSFVQLCQFQMHMEVHKRQKEFRCEIENCKKRFGKLENLNNHIKIIHAGPKEYKCQKCEKAFALESGLEKHTIKIHEGQYDGKCETCGEVFGNIKNLKKHVKKTHMATSKGTIHKLRRQKVTNRFIFLNSGLYRTSDLDLWLQNCYLRSRLKDSII